MKVTYTEGARRWGEGLAMLQNATPLLEEALGQYADKVTAEWDLSLDGGKPVYTLTLRGLGAEKSASFQPEHLRYASYLVASVRELWGDLLQAWSDAQHRKVQALVRQMEGE